MDKEKYVLQQVVRFGIIAQDAHRDSPYQTSVATEQDGQRFPAPVEDLTHQGLVRDFNFLSRGRNGRTSGVAITIGDGQPCQTDCDRSVHEI